MGVGGGGVGGQQKQHGRSVRMSAVSSTNHLHSFPGGFLSLSLSLSLLVLFVQKNKKQKPPKKEEIRQPPFGRCAPRNRNLNVTQTTARFHYPKKKE